MFDARLRRLIDPPLNGVGRGLSRIGVKADQLTWLGFAIGLGSVVAIMLQAYVVALIFIILNRVLDGLDGAVARTQSPSDYGAYIDIVLDMIFYAGVAFAFGVAEPGTNALPSAWLLTGFMAASSSFLAFSIMAEKRGLKTEAQGEKSIYYLAGLMEGGETIAFFALMCLIPAWFPYLAGVFGALCLVTAAARITVTRAMLKTS